MLREAGKDGVGLHPRGVLGPPGGSDVECGQRPIVHDGAHGLDDVLKGRSSGCREAKASQLGGVDDVDVDVEHIGPSGRRSVSSSATETCVTFDPASASASAGSRSLPSTRVTDSSPSEVSPKASGRMRSPRPTALASGRPPR